MLSILRAGQRCGVHVILLRDQKSALPDGVSADEISASCQIVRAEKGKPDSFRFAEGPYAGLPLVLDTPLPDDALIPLLTRIGRHAKTAARVEVPFDAIAPKPETFWSLSSAKNLRVPVGRAGATRLQQFLLGEGTSQHALIAGKTGSGKSTLLHAIITGIACWYSPAEVELWLVDFKKGVEFKTYAEHALPHARAVAIESDREFGLSVLEGLDAASFGPMRACRASCSSSTSSRSSSSTTTAWRRTRRCSSTASCARAARSACTRSSARRRSAARTRSPAAPWARWASASRSNAAKPIRS